jgi:hypothetical protein
VYGSAAVADEGGRWSIERVQEVVKSGGSVEQLVDETARRNLYRKDLEKRLTDGGLPGCPQKQCLQSLSVPFAWPTYNLSLLMF